MIAIAKEHEFLVCIDSDGTIMDTMRSKHETAFGPCFLDVFGIKEHRDEILNEWLSDNLYRKTRGINRFQGLDRILAFSSKFGYVFPGYDEYHKWVVSTPKFDVSLLKQACQAAKSKKCMELALLWSSEVNKTIAAMREAKPFDNVVDDLRLLSREVDLLGVSSANPAAVNEEWTRLGIKTLFKEVGCQDKGSKATIIKEGLANGYDPKKTVMMGDALGDYDAAVSAGVLFFPILPRHESESWTKFVYDALPRLLNGRYDEEYQQKLLSEFLSSLE